MGLRNIQYIGQAGASEQLEANILSYFNWNFLNTYAFANVNIASSGNYGGSASQLRMAANPSYTDGQVWESYRKQWVWQSGTECTSQPIQISGVYVNNIFLPATGVGPYKFSIDYPNGRVIFDTAIATTSTVKAEYSYNYIQTYNADSPWWREVQRNSLRVDDSSFLNKASGTWQRTPEQRVQLPAVVFQATPNMSKIPFQLGDHSHIHEQEVRCYIITETNRDLKWIVDSITGQYDSIIPAFNINTLFLSGVYPINMDNGSLNSSTMDYPDLVRNFSWNRPIRFKKVSGWIPEGVKNSSDIGGFISNVETPIFSAVIQLSLETYLN